MNVCRPGQKRKERRVDARRRVIRPIGSVLTLAVFLSTPAWGVQGGGNGGAGATSSSGGSGPWHGATSAAGALEHGATDARTVVEAARSQIVLGRPERAVDLLERYPVPDTALGGAAVEALAVAHYRQGDYLLAARLFRRAVDASREHRRRGILLVRSAEAYERAGYRPDAESLYRAAAATVPDIAPWLAIRAARVAPVPVAALPTFRSVPREAVGAAARARADILLDAGDTVVAAYEWSAMGDFGRAADLLDAIGARDDARRLVYRALADRTAPQARNAAALAVKHYPPRTAGEVRMLARALGWAGRGAEGAAVIEGWLAGHDSTAATLWLLGAMLESGHRSRALRIYGLAAARAEAGADEAEYRRIRLLLRMRRRTAALVAMRAYPARFEASDRAPTVAFLLADLLDDRRRHRAADSLYEQLALRWPDADVASSARLRLAQRALRRGDTTEAVRRFRDEARSRGERAGAARFLLGRLVQAQGDTTSARTIWRALAHDDSLGYYGTIAREAVGLAPPHFGTIPYVPPGPRVGRLLASLDLLDGAGLEGEAAYLLEYLTGENGFNIEEQLAIAEGLNARGRTVQGIRMGWRISRTLTLNHPRVIRVVFPFPDRELVEAEAAEFGLDPFLVAAVIRQESAFDPAAVSRAGARGLMQLMPATARGLARRHRLDWNNRFLTVADANVHVGAAHLATLLSRYHQRLIPTLAAYNAGSTPVQRWLRYPEASDPFAFVERIPYRETRGYVRTVLRNRALYAALYGAPSVP